jgi:hypothetical protein
MEKTITHATFLFSNNGFEYTKVFENALKSFANAQQDVGLETYLTDLLSQKNLIQAEAVERIVVHQTVYYDNDCTTSFSPKVHALLNDLGATLEITTQRNYTGETLYQVLDRIRERPAMYMGDASISTLNAFVYGFLTACNGGTQETPPFSGFNDFLGKYYGKHTTAGWKNLILADNYGNEQQALTDFYRLLDAYRAAPDRPSSRDIVHRLLYVAFLHFRGDSHEIGKALMEDDADLKQIRGQLWAINRVADLLHNSANPLKMARDIDEYDTILGHIFERARNYPYLHNYIKTNAPEAVYYECELWSGIEDECIITTVIKSQHPQKDMIIGPNEKLIQTFFAINNEQANEVKEAFHTLHDNF